MAAFYRDKIFCKNVEGREKYQKIHPFEKEKYKIAKKNIEKHEGYFTAVHEKLDYIINFFSNITYLSSTKIKEKLIK